MQIELSDRGRGFGRYVWELTVATTPRTNLDANDHRATYRDGQRE